MKKRLVLAVTALALAAPAFAATEMTDSQLESVAAGTGSLAPVTTNLNVNASPIIVTQTALALNLQQGWVAAEAKGKGHAYGLLKQSGFAVANNTAKINYHVVQINK